MSLSQQQQGDKKIERTLISEIDEVLRILKEGGEREEVKKKKDVKIDENKNENQEAEIIDEETTVRLKTPRGTRDYNPNEQKLRTEMMKKK